MIKSSFIKPYYLEVFCGPMNSGKSKVLIDLVDTFTHIKDCKYLICKPKIDNRGEKKLWSRFTTLSFNCHFVDEKNPKEIIDLIEEDTQILIIDEANFFEREIIEVIETLLRKGLYIIVGGLDLNFRGEPFKAMPDLIAKANKVHKLKGVCEFPGCFEPATRTQRLINGEPAPYNSPEILVGDDNEGYQCRCLKHHIIPKNTIFNYVNK